VKRKALALIIILVLSFFIAGGWQFVDFAEANMYPYPIRFVRVGEGSPPAGTKPIPVLISSPKNNTAYASNNVTLTFNASVSEYYGEIYYTASWDQSKTYIKLNSPKFNPPTFSINLTDIPEGPRWLEVYAVQEGRQTVREDCGSLTLYYLTYDITGSSMVNFTIDTIPPKLSILSLENKTYSAADVPLDFVSSEPISQSIYSLDGQANVTVAGNSTLTGIAIGDHNLRVYAEDEAGNMGASETIWFSVSESFPTVPIVAASVAVVVLVSAGLLVYFRKRKH
jgi:hypothetical protein